MVKRYELQTIRTKIITNQSNIFDHDFRHIPNTETIFIYLTIFMVLGYWDYDKIRRNLKAIAMSDLTLQFSQRDILEFIDILVRSLLSLNALHIVCQIFVHLQFNLNLIL